MMEVCTLGVNSRICRGLQGYPSAILWGLLYLAHLYEALASMGGQEEPEVLDGKIVPF